MPRLVFLPSILLFSLLLILAGCTPGILPADLVPAPTIATPGVAPSAVAATATVVNTATMTVTRATTTPVTADDPLANTDWQLVSFGGPGEEEPVVGETIPTLAFDANGKAGGSGSCNTFGGAYQAAGNTLSFSQLTTTRKACAEAVMAQEKRYLTALEATTQFEFVREYLRLSSGSGGEVLTLIQTAPGDSPVTETSTVTATATITLPEGTPVITTTSTATTTPPVTVTATVTAPTGGGVGTCTWTASHNLQPPGPATLTVRGACTMPTPGYTLTLSRAEPQGINPAILLLNLLVEAPTGMVAQVVTPTEVVYTEETDQHFDQVTILAEEGMGGNVAVEEVQ